MPAAASNGVCSPAVQVSGLTFSYPDLDGTPAPGTEPVVRNMTMDLLPGQRCLLIGANGAGKSTLLRVLAGKHMVPAGSVRVLGQSPFHDTQLSGSGALSYIGGSWDRDIAFAGYSIPLQGDFPAGKMIRNVPGIPAERSERLMKVLDVNPEWRMHQVSDGQRRRVQLCLGLLRPFQVLLLDEITVDLDVLGRADLFAFLREECEERNVTIIYATHIFDGLEHWPTHVMYLARGELQAFQPVDTFPEIQRGDLLGLVCSWLTKEREFNKADGRLPDGTKAAPADDGLNLANWNNGWAAGRLASSIKHSSNAVLR
ncbi:hypothetical protein WJX74_010560 [Apatococcus lobatus]|uniref:ABC transporter domain-containing protein n=1 Tax=Apatococcus lobatus TaxID=904363 RepID=A0AAW1QY14_9CHLO